MKTRKFSKLTSLPQRKLGATGVANYSDRERTRSLLGAQKGYVIESEKEKSTDHGRRSEANSGRA